MPKRKDTAPATAEEKKLERVVARLQAQIAQLEAELEEAGQQRTSDLRAFENELGELRSFIVAQTAEPFPQLLEAFLEDPRHTADGTERPRDRDEPRDELVALLVEAARLRSNHGRLDEQRAPCPLCEQYAALASEEANTGYKLPLGLERHLVGWGNVQQCLVMQVAAKLVRERVAAFRRRQRTGIRAIETVALRRLPSPIRLVGVPRELAEGEQAIWEIDSDPGVTGSYADVVPVPQLIRWVLGTKQEAEFIRELWVKALRWKAATAETRVLVSMSRSIPVVATILNYPEEQQPDYPTWDIGTRQWLGSEPVVVLFGGEDWRPGVDQRVGHPGRI